MRIAGFRLSWQCPPCLRNAAAATSLGFTAQLSIAVFWKTADKLSDTWRCDLRVNEYTA
jgi:hypothetical protein